MSTMKTTRQLPTPALQSMADSELDLRARVGYVALLLAALMMTGITGALWLTEPALPLRTRVACGVMTVIGLSWATFASWALRHRRARLARQEIVAGRMAVAFTSVFVVGAVSIGYTVGGPAPRAAAAVGVVMLVVAVGILVRAHRNFSRLMERRRVLERALGREVA